jgi:quercetin dioxygenase-like cupin family protein
MLAVASNVWSEKRTGGVMKSKSAIALLVAVVAVVGAAVFGGNVLATPPTPFPGLTTAILAQSTLDNAKKFQFAQALLRSRQLFGTSDFYVVDNKFEANATTGWHSHPGPSVVTIAAGTMTNYESKNGTCTKQVFNKGDSFVDAGGSGDTHMLRNESGASAETIAVQVLPSGTTRRIDVTPAPSNCNFEASH